jgi:hypothetical protein
MKTFMAYFDTLGFEWIVCTSDFEKKKMWATLKGEKLDLPVPRYAILRAQANPQRFPEIWVFDSEISLKELIDISNESPQVLADAVRQCGHNLFKTPKTESVIV